ncbi:MAG: DUF3048 domain-containing protein [Candidatus Moraniibacteriota bacterium]|nr:MAG: DUF3048 domain-containing protein [Candidatus Moranbacteria bacterium]
MSLGKKLSVLAVIVAIAAGIAYYFEVWPFASREPRQAIEIENGKSVMNDEPEPMKNTGPVSPITGIACEHWDRRPVAVMQPADVSARPAAGFSSADMVFEMPVFTGANTRLMGVYLCDIPEDIGSMRSARHDYLPLAKSLDAIFVHWGYSKFAETLLSQKVIDNINCLTTSFCPRWTQTGIMKYEDTGHITRDAIEQAIAKYGYRTTGEFSGYPHQEEAPFENRPTGGHLRLAFPNPYDVSYDYDRSTNSYLRIWDKSPDTDKNNGERIAPKNIAVLIAESEQIKLATDYVARGVQNPWDLVPKDEQDGLDYGGIGRYNNINMGDPWFDTKDSGDAFYYFNGKEYKGTWKKDKKSLDSKLTFLDESGKEVLFVPGQIWVDVMEPGQGIKWEPGV